MMHQEDNALKDLFIIGGGINGTGIARDAAGRGLTVTLAEKDDVAAHTSSASSKLIHGGLRYLEHYEFRLVRESLQERETLLYIAPHLIKPLRFVLPHHKKLRPAPILRLGLFLYDHIGGRKLLPPTNVRNLRTHETGNPLQSSFRKGFEYSDCWVDDARLVCLNAVDAHSRGADILVGHEVIGAERKGGRWHIKTKQQDGTTTEHAAKALINAAGPWVDVAEARMDPAPKSRKQIRMVKGSHIVVPQLYEGDQAYTFQHDDQRIVFAIPYERKYTLIGTTDVPYDNDPSAVTITDEEQSYLCEVASSYFRSPVRTDQIVWSYSGVRPLVDDGTENASHTTRDYILEMDLAESIPLLSIYGGKITTYRRLAEEVMDKLQPHLGFSADNWTAHAPLPGGDMGYAGMQAFQQETAETYRWLPSNILARYVRAYGTNTHKLLSGAKSQNDLGEYFGAGLFEAELTYMCDEEWARTAEDALWRRSKLGLHMSELERQAVAHWFTS